MLGPRVRSVSHQVKDIRTLFRWCGKLLSKCQWGPNGLLVGWIIRSGMVGWMVELGDSVNF